MSNNYYELDPNEKRIDTHLLYITSAKYGTDWHSLMHVHSCTELFYVTSGSGTFCLEEQKFDIREDDMIIVSPNVEHTEVGSAKNPLEYIVLGVDRLEFMFGEEHDSRFSHSNFREYRGEILVYLKALLKEVETKSVHYNVICQNLLELLIVKIMQITSFSVTLSSGKKSSKECATVKRYIDSNYKENITLDMLAELTHMNKYYLVHTFQRENGISPITYLIKRRIRESKYLLGNTNYTMSQISQMLGFSSQSYFSQSFKREENVSPNEYRRRARLKAESENPPSENALQQP